MRRFFAGSLTLLLCCSTWLAAADTEKKEPAPEQAPTNSAQQLQQMQAQLKKQQEQIEKLLTQLQQTHQALQQAQEKLQTEHSKRGSRRRLPNNRPWRRSRRPIA